MRKKEGRREELRCGPGEMSNYKNAPIKMASHSGLESVGKFHFIQTATTICYCGKEMERVLIIDRVMKEGS